MDLFDRVTYVNREAELMTGRARLDLLGHPLRCVFEAIDAALPHGRLAVPPRIPGAAHGGQRVGACLLNRRDSLWIRVEVSAMPIHDRGGRIAGAIIVFRDVLKLPAGERIPQRKEPIHGEVASIQPRCEEAGSEHGAPG